MASIGRWLYRLFSICLPCLKSSETGEKETEDYRQDLNPFKNKVEENTELGNEYPDNLNPFGSEEDEENKNLNGKEEKGQQEDEYPDGLNPFASDDEEYEQENNYPEELNPFTDDAENEQENDYPDELNPFADDEENEQENDYPEELNPFTDDEENYYPDKLNPFTDDEKNEQKNDYPEELNPFTDDEENEQENDYPDELNPFADEKEDKADTAIANQCSLELSPELNSPAINGSSSTVLLPNEEKVDDGKDESEQHEDEYPDCLNPFAIEADENEQHDDDYPDELNPFFDEEGDAADTAKVNQCSKELASEQTPPAINGPSSTVPLPIDEKAEYRKDESEEEKYPDSLNPFAKEDDENDYPEELNPFADDKGEAADTAKVNQRSPELAPELTPPAINGCPSKVPLPNEEKTEDGKDESKQQEVEYPDSLNPFGSEDDENQYPEELNPFADDATDTAKVNQCSLELAELTLPAINGSSATSPLANKRKAKSFKKRHAPDPPVIERIIPNEESAPGVSKPLGSLPIIYKVKDYDEAFNSFASEDEEAAGDTTGKQSSLAQLTAATIDGCPSLNDSSKGKNKGKSSKKRRAPDPPVIEGKDSASQRHQIESVKRQLFPSWHRKQRSTEKVACPSR